MTQPRLSILLPTHNRADTIEWALLSLAAQTEGDFEVLICGDGCTDGTAEIARAWEKKDSRFHWFDLPKGPGFGYANRNQVLQRARGEFIGFMAHDDLVFRDHFARMIEPLANPEIHLVASRPLWVDNSGTIVPVANNLESHFAQQRLIGGFHDIPATCYLHRRSAFADVGWWDESLPIAADLDLWRRILLHYGPKCVRYLTTPSALHFRAIWKMAEHRDPHELSAWPRVLATSGALPEILRCSLKEDQLPQAGIGQQLLASDGPIWEAKIRVATELALDSYALEQNDMLRLASRNIRRLTRSNEELARQKKEIEDQRRELQKQIVQLSERPLRMDETIRGLKVKLKEQRERAEKWKQKLEALRLKRAAIRRRRWWQWFGMR